MGAFLGRLMGRILLYEHFTATSDSASPLYAEGKAMVDAVEADLCGVRGIEVIRWIGREPLAYSAKINACRSIRILMYRDW